MKYPLGICLLCCISSVLSADCESSLLEITKEGLDSHDIILGMGLEEGSERETNSGVVFRCIDKELLACLSEDDDDDDCFKIEKCGVLTVSDSKIECGNSARKRRGIPAAVSKSNHLFSRLRSRK